MFYNIVVILIILCVFVSLNYGNALNYLFIYLFIYLFNETVSDTEFI